MSISRDTSAIAKAKNWVKIVFHSDNRPLVDSEFNELQSTQDNERQKFIEVQYGPKAYSGLAITGNVGSKQITIAPGAIAFEGHVYNFAFPTVLTAATSTGTAQVWLEILKYNRDKDDEPVVLAHPDITDLRNIAEREEWVYAFTLNNTINEPLPTGAVSRSTSQLYVYTWATGLFTTTWKLMFSPGDKEKLDTLPGNELAIHKIDEDAHGTVPFAQASKIETYYNFWIGSGVQGWSGTQYLTQPMTVAQGVKPTTSASNWSHHFSIIPSVLGSFRLKEMDIRFGNSTYLDLDARILTFFTHIRVIPIVEGASGIHQFRINVPHINDVARVFYTSDLDSTMFPGENVNNKPRAWPSNSNWISADASTRAEKNIRASDVPSSYFSMNLEVGKAYAVAFQVVTHGDDNETFITVPPWMIPSIGEQARIIPEPRLAYYLAQGGKF